MVLERLKEYLDAKEITVAAFERAAGLSNASFRKTLQSGKGIGTDKLENILSIYPDLSAEWLLRGNGPMLCGGDKMTDNKLFEICKKLVTLFEQKDQVINDLIEAVRSID